LKSGTFVRLIVAFLQTVVYKQLNPAADLCLEPMSEGHCTEYVLLWYYYTVSGECRPFVYGGCGGNRNRFSSKQDCESQCILGRRGKVLIRIQASGSNINGQR
uniref:Si:dkey-117n7.5 n=1 Tax=Sinocyclocheilus grahami TaxID=75366 RepID=A0A672LK34_SINGR